MKRCTWLILFALLLVPAMGFAAQTAWKPSKPITLVVPFGAGGATDLTARIIAQYAAEEQYFGKPMVVVNRTGAGGITGTTYVWSQAPKDGYTMAIFNFPTIAVQPLVYQTSFNPDLIEHVAVWRSEPEVLCVGADSPFKNLDDMRAYIASNPGKKITFSGGGLYGPQHLMYLQFEKTTGLPGEYIPTTGGAEGLKNIITDTVQAGFLNASDALRNKDRLRVLAVGTKERYPLLPDAPTFAEIGLPAIDDSVVSACGAAFPKGVDPAIAASASEIISRMLKDERIIQQFTALGCPPSVYDAAGSKTFFDERMPLYKELLGATDWKK